jgi:hypothetical protein
MSTAVSFERPGYGYVLRFAYNADLVAMVKTVPSYARSWDTDTKEWTVHAAYAPQWAGDMRALGHLITGPESEPERCKQQRNGDLYCSSRCRQRAYHRRRSSTTGARR